MQGNAFTGGLTLAPKLAPPLSTALYGTDTPMDYMSQYGPQYSQVTVPPSQHAPLWAGL